MGFLKKWLFGEEDETIDPVDLSLIGLDMHSHLLPGIDDGATDIENSIQLISHLYELGYRKFITTPHTNSLLLRIFIATFIPTLLNLSFLNWN